MVRNKLAAAILSAGLLMPAVSSALGVGDYTLKSYLNQPLDLEIDLIQAKDLSPDEIVASLASQDEFTTAGLERGFLLQDIRFEIQQRPDGHFVIVARSNRPINEPFLDFLIAVQWPQGRILREYTVLLDPPVYKAGAPVTATAAPVVSEAAPLPAPPSAPAVAPAATPPPATSALPPAMSSLPPPPSEKPSDRAPSRQSPAAAPAAPAPGGDYTVRAGDTMMEIAQQYRGGASVQQTMIAIQRANADAFINGNINLVKKGVVLRIPDQAEIQQVSTAEAKNAVASQHRAWRELLDRRGISIGAPKAKAQLEAGGAAPAKPVAKTGTGAGQVTLVAPTASGKGAAAASGRQSESKKPVSSPALDKAANENKALSAHLGDLDAQVKQSAKAIKLKDDQIAGLQQELDKLRKQKGQAAKAPAAAEAAAPAAEGAKPTAEQPAEAAKPAAKKPAAKPKAPEPVAEEPAPESGSSMLAPIAGILVLLGIGGGAFWWMRKKKAASPVAMPAVEEEVADHEAEIAEDLAQLQGLAGGEEHAEQAAGGGESEGGDPLGEADMYMAYGRFQQAADILYAALQREPERGDIRVKLAEVYAEMGDTGAAREQASQVVESGNAALRAQAEAVLARAGGAAAPAPAAAEEQMPSLDELALEFSGGKAEPEAEPAKQEMSFDLSDEFALEEPAAPVKAAAPAPAAVAEEPELEFSLDDVDFDAGSRTEVRPAASDVAEELSLEGANLGEFSLDEEVPAAAPPVAELSLEDEFGLEAPAAAPALEDNFDFAATTGAQPKLPAEAVEEVKPAPVAEASLDLESELADLEADLSAEGVQAAPSAGGGDDFDFLSDSDENATKLDLAKAYIDMGDAEGARDILNEVVADGNPTQKAEAQKLLAQVG